MKLSTTYKNHIFRYLKSLLSFAQKIYELNVQSLLTKITGFSNVNELKKEMNFFTYDEFKRFISQEKSLKYKTYFEILYYCGLRKGEANALTWNDVDFTNHSIHINKNLVLKIKVKNLFYYPQRQNQVSEI